LRQFKSTGSKYSSYGEDNYLKSNQPSPTTLTQPGCRSQIQTRHRSFLCSCSTALYCITYLHLQLPVFSLNSANNIQMQSTWPLFQCRNACPGSDCQCRKAVHKQTLQPSRSLAPYPSYT